MKMKLLFVISQFYKGGAENALLNLLKFLDKSKYEIDLMVMDQRPVEKAVSLIPQVPKEVCVIDVWQQEKRLQIGKRLRGKYVLTPAEKQADPVSALLFARDHEYDWAFHVGEWWVPAFVAQKVKAKHKAAWIHGDLEKATWFNPDAFFGYDHKIDRYIFVSERSMTSALENFPFLKNRSGCIYNITDVQKIHALSLETIPEDDDYFDRGLPVVVTCANIRREKNHKRQLRAMSILKKRGLDFIWINLGATSEVERCKDLLLAAEDAGLEERFFLLGPKENPYQYMGRADAVTVLSDCESWSLVITESKVLGIPVVSTKTSGALEQIRDRDTGILTEFSAVSIANGMEALLKSKELQTKIRSNIKNFDNTSEILQSFEHFLTDTEAIVRESAPERLLYVIDDINYVGGAHIATKLQILELLKENRDISVFSSSAPNVAVRNELAGVHFLSWPDFPEDILYNRRIFDCLTDPALTREEKRYKFKMTWEAKIKRNSEVFGELVLPCLSKLFSQYDIICVMSEGSGFRSQVAASSCRRKVQWIHTDYSEWKDKNEWTKKMTKDDSELYRHFDKIIVLVPNIRESFIQLYPHLASKVVVNNNLIPVERILEKALEKEENTELTHFVTVGRVDYQKAYERLFEVLQELFNNGYRFRWTIIGDGEDFAHIKGLIAQSELVKYISMTGSLKNPFPYVKKADVFALLSQVEGLPNTIYEALILGVPVIATKVGGTLFQIKEGENGWLVENEEDSIYAGLEHILQHPQEIEAYKNNLKLYQYENDKVLDTAKTILFGAQKN